MSLKSELFGTRALEQSHLCTCAEQSPFGLQPEVTFPPGCVKLCSSQPKNLGQCATGGTLIQDQLQKLNPRTFINPVCVSLLPAFPLVLFIHTENCACSNTAPTFPVVSVMDFERKKLKIETRHFITLPMPVQFAVLSSLEAQLNCVYLVKIYMYIIMGQRSENLHFLHAYTLCMYICII